MAIYDCLPSCGIPKGCMDVVGMTFLEMEGRDPDIEEESIKTSSNYLEGVCLLDNPKFKAAVPLTASVFSSVLPSMRDPEAGNVISLTLYNDDQQILMAGMPWWFLIIEGALALLGKLVPKWIPIDGVAKHFHEIPVINRFIVTKKHKLVFNELADTKDFYEGMLKCQEMGYKEGEALKIVFRYLLLTKERMQSLGVPGESYFTLKTVKDVAIAGFKPLQIQHTADLVAEELKLPLPFEMIEPMANLNREIPPQAIDRSLLSTQEIAKKQGAEQQNLEWESVKDILSVLLRKLQPMEDAPDGELSVCVGPYSVKIGRSSSGEGSGLISLPVVSLSKEGLVSTLTTVVDKLNKGKPLTDSEKLLVEHVRKNPIIEQVVEVYTRPYEDAVIGTSRWMDLLKEARKPENAVLRRALWEVSQMSGGPVGLVLPDGTHLQINWKAPIFNQGAEVMLPAPYYMGPYSFTKGLQILVGVEGVTKLPAILGWDENGRILVVDMNAMQHFNDVLEWMRVQRGMQGSDIWNAYAPFYNDVLVVWKALYEDFALPEGSPRSVSERTKLFRKINWGVGLRQRLDRFVGEMEGVVSSTADVRPKEKSTQTVSVTAQLTQIKGEYVDYFDAEHQLMFETTFKLLEEASLKGDAAEVAMARDAVVTVVDAQIQSSSKKLTKATCEGFSKVGPRSFGFLDEVNSWMATSIEQLKSGDVSPDIGEAIVARNMSGLVPSLVHAKEYAEQGSYLKAFTMYDLMIWDPETSEAERVKALVGMLDLAVKRYDFFRIALGLQELDKMVKRGTAVTPEVAKVVARFMSYETPLFPVEVPQVLRDKVAPATVTAENAGMVLTNGGGMEKFNWKKVLERGALLPQTALEKIGAAIASARSGELFGYKADFLKVVALSNELELEGLFKSLYPDAEYRFRLSEVKPFHQKVATIVNVGLDGGTPVLNPLPGAILLSGTKRAEVAAKMDFVGDLLGAAPSTRPNSMMDVSAQMVSGGALTLSNVKTGVMPIDVKPIDVAEKVSGVRRALRAVKSVARLGRRAEKR